MRPPSLPPGVSNIMCNEQNIGVFIMTNQKRWGCVIQNYHREDVLEFCGKLEATLSTTPYHTAVSCPDDRS